MERASEDSEFNVPQSQSVGGSDHPGFYNKDIPIMFFHTTLTDLYHTPDDDLETIDVDGAATTIDLTERVIREIAKLPRTNNIHQSRSTPTQKNVLARHHAGF